MDRIEMSANDFGEGIVAALSNVARLSQLEGVSLCKALLCRVGMQKVCPKTAPRRAALQGAKSSSISFWAVLRGGAGGGSSHGNCARIIGGSFSGCVSRRKIHLRWSVVGK